MLEIGERPVVLPDSSVQTKDTMPVIGQCQRLPLFAREVQTAGKVDDSTRVDLRIATGA
jgi:hypothetical protein